MVTGNAVRIEIRQAIRLAAPLAAAQLAQISMGFVDTIMIGRLGPDVLAAGALGAAVFFPLLIVCMGVLSAVSPMVSQAYGAGDRIAAGRSVRQGFWLATMLTVPAILLLWNAGHVLLWMGQEEALVAPAQSYLRAISWGFLPGLWLSALRNFVEGLSRPRPVLIITLSGVVFNVFWNYVLMFGKLGFPALGLTGTGIATALGFWWMFLLLVVYVRWRPVFSPYRVFSRLGRPDRRYFAELLHIGWPIGILHGLEAGLFSVTALLMGLIDSTVLAAHQIALQCAAVTFMVPMGIGIATSVRVGQAVGAGNPEGARLAGFVGMGLGAGFMLMAATAFWTIPGTIISVYLDVADPANAEVIATAVMLLSIAAVFQVFDGIQVTASGALRGLKDTRVPMIVGLVAYWGIGLTVGYYLGFHTEMQGAGLWWGLVLGLASAAVMLSFRFRRRSTIPLASDSLLP